jgi:hypothetical protein
MKVWIVFWVEWEHWEVKGVVDSEEKAKAIIANAPEHLKSGYSYEEYEVK